MAPFRRVVEARRTLGEGPLAAVYRVPDDQDLASAELWLSVEVLRLGVAHHGGRDVHGYLARARAVRERSPGYVTDRQIDRAKRSGRA